MPLGPAPRIDTDLEHQQTLRFGEQATLVLHTPGHTPGSVCFSLKTPDGMLLLAGDTLFRMSVGRTDFPGGDADQLQGSIRDQILSLDDDTRVITGHGPETTVGFERRANPFLR
jgi:glyoxylase-like metal-dependent hydrolase (beta-lactamase superfamily II)